ncbi:SDR family NAD(P)-dependent oxidoreductase [Psychromarinibacter sp. C21-152]|uniref:SDR family NAD(P)-dependent oxidoreductase n=1 Tax=Psychromarinibacter sediminicola TaxID=3033385 RepID=A0AAE3NPQ4_9RHOB|nr:SDR family NAD(P)-dependent oxidoreductase [Psychromarinibacter sediminicola]MDF0600156.1 SDR family NAD(P)-dependent oxidoreductase [Psychromarinibacter sediminicola]
MTEDAPKVALITGASRGLGAALAEALAATHHVVAVARTTGALEELDDRIQAAGGHATLAPMDVTVPDAMAHLCRSIYDRWGSLDLWAHTAVQAPPLSPADHVDGKEIDKCLAVNVKATATLIPMVAPLLSGDGARALFFDDPHGGEKFFGAYAAGKAAQIALARAWAAETARLGPRVHVLTPNPMPTATRARFFPGEDRSALADPRDEANRLLAEIA